MIYDKAGVQISFVFDKTGNDTDKAYDVIGNQVYSKGTPGVDYSNYSFVQKWASKSIRNTQGFDIYDGKVFWVSKSGNASVPADCYVWNLSDGSQALSSPTITVYSGHGNNLCFDFPKLYADSAYTPHVYVNTMTEEFVATLAKTLYINDGCVDCDACIDETDKSILWTLGHTAGPSNTEAPFYISKWDLSQLADNGDGTFTPRRIQTVITPQPACFYYQGCKFHDGMLWYASGYVGSSRAYVYAIDPNTGTCLYTIDCDTTAEPEGLAFYPDNEAVGGYALYVGFAGMVLRKYTFAAK